MLARTWPCSQVGLVESCGARFVRAGVQEGQPLGQVTTKIKALELKSGFDLDQ